MDNPAPKHHITATIDENVFQRLEEYREANKEMVAVPPDRSKLIEDAIVLYLQTHKPKPL